MNKQKIITWVLFFFIFLFVFQTFTKKNAPTPETVGGAAIIVSPSKTEFATGEEVTVKVRNNTANKITLPSGCPKNPFKVLALVGDKIEERTSETKLNCALSSPDVVIEPNKEQLVTYTYWNHSLFGEIGKYKVQIDFANGTGTQTFVSPEFAVVATGFWRKLFRTAFYQPLYNVLVLFIDFAPFKDLGLAIILLTLAIRLILLVPSQRAIESQRRMQELQPRLAHIKKKYEGNQERIAQETMALWKEHKVNPFGSCLPTLIQFPVLIALFYVIRNGLNPDNIYLLYSPLKDVDLSNIHTNFLGILDLMRVNTIVLPIIIGGLQFLQMKLAMMTKKNSDQKPQAASEMETATKTMIYIMPVMIALFTASVPAGVGLYWGVSTLFAIGQQIVANRKTAKAVTA
ncbi:membrane protein insertase YidC [Candidatus Peregrinibacteria bacterium]|nr:membrane protein insertase YidC [Candidatus Peregrinibacteria bacterium]